MDIYKKSEDVLKKIIKAQKKIGFEIILIGGWAVYCYNPYMKSKDIDFLILEKDVWKLENFLSSVGFRKTGKVLEKIGFAMLVEDDKIELDIYDKKIAKLNIKEIFDKKMFVKKRFFEEKVAVADLNLLMALKIMAASERIGTGKGMKDISDILALLDKFYDRVDFEFVKSLIDEKTVKNVLSVVFSDYKKIKSLYPMRFLQFQKIKQSLL
jgi:hypothetical protein